MIEAHKERRQKDKCCIMTTVFKKARPMHPTRTLNDDLLVVTNVRGAECDPRCALLTLPPMPRAAPAQKHTGQLLVYDNDVEEGEVSLPVQQLAEHTQVEFRYDLLDTQVDVCSPEVLVHFSDNYDYQDVRLDYLRNEVQNADLGWKYFAHVIENEYAARIQDLRTYHAISRDVMRRWAYPLVPDSNFSGMCVGCALGLGVDVPPAGETQE